MRGPASENYEDRAYPATALIRLRACQQRPSEAVFIAHTGVSQDAGCAGRRSKQAGSMNMAMFWRILDHHSSLPLLCVTSNTGGCLWSGITSARAGRGYDRLR